MAATTAQVRNAVKNLRLPDHEHRIEQRTRGRSRSPCCDSAVSSCRSDTPASTDSCHLAVQASAVAPEQREAALASYAHYPDDGRRIEGEFPLPNNLSRRKPDNGDVVADRRVELVYYCTSIAHNLTRNRARHVLLE